MIKKSMLTSLGALLLLAPFASATIIHAWTFDDPAGTLISGAANSGTVGGVSFTGGDPGWTTNGAGSLEKKFASGNVLVQSVADMGTSINFGDEGKFVRFEWDVSWNLPASSGFGREWFMINRNVGGTNQFRFALENFADNTNLLLRTTAAGFTEGSAVQHLAINLTDSPTGNLVLQVDFTFNADNTEVIGVEAAYSLDGGALTSMTLGTGFNPYNLTDIGELRSHAKGNYNDDNFYSLNSVTVTVIPEPSVYAALLGLIGLGLVLLRRRRKQVR